VLVFVSFSFFRFLCSFFFAPHMKSIVSLWHAKSKTNPSVFAFKLKNFFYQFPSRTKETRGAPSWWPLNEWIDQWMTILCGVTMDSYSCVVYQWMVIITWRINGWLSLCGGLIDGCPCEVDQRMVTIMWWTNRW
jgi:hypothetical protein